MRYLKTFLLTLLAMVSTVTYAQMAKSSEIGNGYYLLYNVGSGEYFTRGNGWNTQASRSTLDQALSVEAKLVDGKYFLRSGINGTNNGLEHLNGGTIYTDQSRGKQSTWTFTQVGDDNGPIYNIVSADNHGGGAGAFLTASAESTVLYPGQAGGDDYAKWRVFRIDAPAAEAADMVGAANASNPLDVTFLIPDANFNSRTLHDRWQMDASNKNLQGGADLQPCAESWRSAFTLSQKISVPNGRYEVKAQAALTDYTNAYDGREYPVVYAGDATTPFINMETADRGTSMTQLSNSFAAGKYEVAPLTVNVTDGTLTLGVRGTRTDTWCIWDNFRLTFFGNAQGLKDAIAKAKALLPELDEANAAGLQEAIDAAQEVADNAQATNAEIEEAIAALEEAYNKYNVLNNAKALAADVLNQVPYALFPENFNWDEGTVKDGKGKDVPVTGMSGADYNRTFKVYKNNNGKYQLASRIAVAALARLLEFADADEKTQAELKKELEEKYGIADFEEQLAATLTQYARLVVETHGEGRALYEQDEPGYSRMYEALTAAGVDNTNQFAEYLMAGSSTTTVAVNSGTGSNTSTEGYASSTNSRGNTFVAKNGAVEIVNTNHYFYSRAATTAGATYAWTGDSFVFTAKKGVIKNIILRNWYNNLTIELENGTTVKGNAAPYYYGYYGNDGKNSAYGPYTIPVNKESYTIKFPTGGYFNVTVEVDTGSSPWEDNGAEFTYSDAYELVKDYLLGQKDKVVTGNPKYDYSAHITNPNIENGTEGWTQVELKTSDPQHSPTNSGQYLTTADGTQLMNYFDFWDGGSGFTYEYSQTLTLPTGRYMLTAAGRASAASLVENSTKDAGILDIEGNPFTGYVYEGPFTQTGAEDPENYFQLYATNNQGVTRAQSFLPQIGGSEPDGVFGYGWNDASVFFTVTNADSVKIGVRAQTTEKGMWISATRFRLTRLGDATLYFDENEDYDDILNYDPVTEQLSTLVPSEIVLHKSLEAGKWSSIVLPAEISDDKLIQAFGEGTKYATPTGAEKKDEGGYISFTSKDLTSGSTSLRQNVPYLIKPAQVSKSNLYVFRDVIATHEYLSGSNVRNYGALSINWDGTNSAYGDSRDVVFKANYKFNSNFTDGYTVEFRDTLKSFSAYLTAADGTEIVAVLIDGEDDILDQQMERAQALGKQMVEWYPGIPEAMQRALTLNPAGEEPGGPDGPGEQGNKSSYTFDDGTFDGNTWTSSDGYLTVTTTDGTINTYYGADNPYLNAGEYVIESKGGNIQSYSAKVYTYSEGGKFVPEQGQSTDLEASNYTSVSGQANSQKTSFTMNVGAYVYNFTVNLEGGGQGGPGGEGGGPGPGGEGGGPGGEGGGPGGQGGGPGGEGGGPGGQGGGPGGQGGGPGGQQIAALTANQTYTFADGSFNGKVWSSTDGNVTFTASEKNMSTYYLDTYGPYCYTGKYTISVKNGDVQSYAIKTYAYEDSKLKTDDGREFDIVGNAYGDISVTDVNKAEASFDLGTDCYFISFSLVVSGEGGDQPGEVQNYTIIYSPETGTYTATNANGNYAKTWESTATPKVTLSTTVNNINVADGGLYGNSNGKTYTLSVGDGNVITGYKFVATPSTGAEGMSVTPAGESAINLPAAGTTVSVEGLNAASASFDVDGAYVMVANFEIYVQGQSSGPVVRELTTDEKVAALKAYRSAVIEARKAYPLSKEYHAAYAEAEELLATEHTELVAGADAAFQEFLTDNLRRFNEQNLAAGIPPITEELRAKTAEYKENIFVAGTLDSGDFILKNVATGKYFGGGNNWGTRASLTDHPEYVTLAKLENGKYTLESRFNNGGESIYLGSNLFIDNSNPIELDITPIGDGVYTIYATVDDGTGFIGYDGATTMLAGALANNTAATQWTITSVEDLTASIAEASIEAPVDATFLIKDANFSRNNRDIDYWTAEHDGSGNFRLSATSSSTGSDMFNFCAEAWLESFDVSQEVELPNGVYALTAQAAITDYYNVGENFPVIYAGEESAPFNVMKAEDQGSTMLQLQTAFVAGEYFVAPIVVEVTDGTLKIGARGSETQKFWAIWDNFVLTAYGNADIEAVRAALNNTGSGEATGIETVETGNGKTEIYTINGVRVNNITKKGVYIVNGKKISVK